MKVLGVNISHHASTAFYDGKLKHYYEEDRFKKIKYWEPSKEDYYYNSINKLLKLKPDIIVYASYDKNYRRNKNFIFTKDEELINLVHKQSKKIKYFFNPDYHHIYHATCGFYFSKFNEAICIIMDGGGSQPTSHSYQEMNSIYVFNKKKIFLKYQMQSNIRFCIGGDREKYSDYTKDVKFGDIDIHFCSKSNPPYEFGDLCLDLGMSPGYDSGKVMGLSSYGYSKKKYNLDYVKVKKAKKLQEKSFEYTCALIDKALSYSNIKNIVLSGGYFLNCVNDFKYVKKYPQLNFFVDPVAHDGGTSIGAAIFYNDYYRY